jgi:ZIP family zinc transporter
MGEAFVWGLVGGSSLVIGGVVALRITITRRLLGLIMAFGAGVLITAANTMMPEALHYGGKLAGFLTTGLALAFAISSQ